MTPLATRTRRAAATREKVAVVAEKPKEVYLTLVVICSDSICVQLASFEEEEEATTRGVQHVNRCLKEACRASGDVHYFTFIVDPQSYAHTVENIFHFSFLIKVCRTHHCTSMYCTCRRGELGLN